jgi:hypothetical protein
MDKRLKEIQQGTLTESRLNSDFVFWLKESGPNWLLGVLLVLCGVLGWNWWQQKREASRDAAWLALSEATSPQSLLEVASAHGDTDGIAVIARLDAADRYLESVRSGVRFDREPGAEDAAVTPELRLQYLGEADRLYAQAAEGLDGSPPSECLLLASSHFGRAAVAESQGDVAAAEQHLKAAAEAARTAYPPLSKVAESRLASLAGVINRPALPSRPAAPADQAPMSTFAFPDPAATAAADEATTPVETDFLRPLGSGAPASTPAAPAQPK